MSVKHLEGTLLQLGSGDLLHEAAADPPQPWRLVRGAISLDLVSAGGRASVVQLALPGDLLGLEPLLGLPTLYRARALVPSALQPLLVPMCAAPDRLLAEALAQQWQRAADMASLRAGSVPERVKRLLLMLASDAPADQPTATCLPRIKDIAALVATTHETVSRVLSSLRRMALLDERHNQAARYNPQRLAASPLAAGMTSSVPTLQG